MVGWTAEELIGAHTPFVYWPEDECGRIQAALDAALSGAAPPDGFRLRFSRRGGERFDVRVTIAPLADGGWVQAVNEADETDGRGIWLAAIVESSEDAVIGKTLEGVILSWNSGAERIFGYTAAEAIGRSMIMLLPSDRPDEERVILDRLRRGERVESFETLRLRKDGSIISVSTTISPIRARDGRIVGASSVTRDITQRRRFEEQMRETQKLESLGVLAGGVAHDFNNLLVGIMGNASLALDTLDAAHPARRMIEGVLQASERAASLTRQLLAYSGKGRFVVQSIELPVLIRDIVALIHTSIPAGVRLRFELDDSLPPIEADVSQIQQLVMNIVINGAEAIGGAGGTVTIRTFLTRGEDGGPLVSLEVEDTGCGMDAATRERMFDPFFTTKFTGRGLGLAAVLGIVRGHGGVINVQSAPGEGTRITVSFPPASRAGSHAGLIEPRNFHGHGTVLVVDDEDVVRDMAQNTLERHGYEVLKAACGREAIKWLESGARIDAVLLDLTMPEMSGEETLQALRRLRHNIPVVVSSGYDEDEAVRRFEGQAIAGFLQKPYTADRLAGKIKAALHVLGDVDS